MFPTMFFSAVLAFVAVVILFKAVRMVPQGYEWTCLLYTSPSPRD